MYYLMPYLIVQFMGHIALSLPSLETRNYLLLGTKIERNINIEIKYKNTRCVNFFFANKNIGLLCLSSSIDFMEDFGVAADSQENEKSSYLTNLKIVTPMAVYNMKTSYLNNRFVYTTKTDCDESNNSIYRATSTCYVTIMPINNNTFIYSNFVLENHINSTVSTTVEEIEYIWSKLKIPQNIIVEP